VQVVRCLLIEPNPESALNEDAARLFMEVALGKTTLFWNKYGRYIREYTHTSARTHTHTHVHLYMTRRMCSKQIRVHMYIHTHPNTHTYTHTHTYIHICETRSKGLTSCLVAPILSNTQDYESYATRARLMTSIHGVREEGVGSGARVRIYTYIHTYIHTCIHVHIKIIYNIYTYIYIYMYVHVKIIYNIYIYIRTIDI
jgi:hypothetical protein